MDTTNNTMRVAKALRERIRQLKTIASAERRSYAGLVAKWQEDLGAWLKTKGVERAKRITQAEARTSRYGNGWMQAILSDAPGPPSHARVETVEKKTKRAAALLRQISMTGQKTIKLSTSDVDDIFGDDIFGDEDE